MSDKQLGVNSTVGVLRVAHCLAWSIGSYAPFTVQHALRDDVFEAADASSTESDFQDTVLHHCGGKGDSKCKAHFSPSSRS